MLWKIAVALLFLLCQNTFAIIHFHCIFTSPSPHIQRWKTIQIKVLNSYFLLTPSKLLYIHLSGCYLVHLAYCWCSVWRYEKVIWPCETSMDTYSSTVSSMIFVQQKMYDCGISCSVAVPEHQEITLLNTLVIWFGEIWHWISAKAWELVTWAWECEIAGKNARLTLEAWQLRGMAMCHHTKDTRLTLPSAGILLFILNSSAV